MAINILQELNLGAAKASFSRDEVETLAEIKNLDVAKKYPNNYDIFCKEDGCKYRLNKTSHSTMQDNLPHPTGKWRRVDSVISSSMPAPITVGDVVLYLGPTVMDQVDHSKVKFQTGKYYRTEYTKVNKQMHAFVQNTAPDTPDTSPTPAVIWFSETSTLSKGSVLFTPVNGSIFDNKEHGIIMTSDWDGQSAISGSSYEYLDNSNSAKLGMVRNSNFDTAFDSFPELTWNMFDTEAELENIKQNVIPEAISSATEEIKTEVKEEVKEDVDANLGQAKKLNDILTDGDIKLLKQGGTEKLVSSKPDATVSDSTIGFVQCDCNRNEETGEVTLNITNVKYGPFTSEEIAENAFVDENQIIVPSGGQFNVYAITCSVTNKVKDAIFHPLKDSNLYQGTISFDVMSFVSRLQEGLPLAVGFAAAAPYKDGEHSGSVDSNTYVSMYNLLEYLESSPPTFSNVPIREIPDIKNRAAELLENETALDLILFVMGGGDDAQLASSNVLELLNEQFVIGTEASGILNEFPTMRNEIEDSITEEFSNVKKLNDSLNEEDVDAIVSRPRESIFDVKSPYITYGNKLLTECTFVKLEFDNGKATITDSATVSDVMADLPGGIQEWLHDGCPAVLFGIKQNNNYIGDRYGDAYTVSRCSFKVDHNGPFADIDRKPENMFGISEVYFAIGNNENEQRNIIADFTACKFTNISIYAPGTEDVDGRHLFGDLIGGYEENGDPIILKYYNKSDYTVLYGIVLLTVSPNIVSEADFTVKNVIASINKRAIPMYQESGLLVDFPKIKEQITSVKEMADEAVELALPKKTGDFIKNNIVNFKEITPLSIPNSSYSQDKVKFDGFVSLGVSKYNETDTSRSIAPVFKNYFDDTKSDYVTSDNLMSDVPTKGWGRYVGIMGSIFSTTYNNMGKSAFENALRSTYCEYNRSKSLDMLFNRISTRFLIVDVYVRYYGNNDIDGNLTTGWIRVEPGANIWDLISGSSFYTGYVQVCVVVKGAYGDWYFENADPFTANANAILDLVSFTDRKVDLNKINELNSADINKIKELDSVDLNKLNELDSVAYSVDNISDSMSDYMSAKWYPTPIAFPDRAYENPLAFDSKDFDFLLYPTFVDAPHSEGSSVEGKNSNYTVYPIPESGENTTVKALYESDNSMYLLFGFFGENLLPESLGGDYTIPATYNESTIESFNRVSKTLWYSDIYMNMHNTFSYSMIKGVNDSVYSIDVSNIFLNFDPRVIKSLYAKVTSTPNLLANPSYTNPNLATMEEFVKVPYVNIRDINTISMEDIVNMCGRPDKTQTIGYSKAIVLFVAEIDKSSFPALATLTTPAYGVSPTTSDNLAIYQAMFTNNESSPIYMARSIDDSLKKTKEVAVEAARYAAATLTAAREYSSYSDLKLLIHEGESGYVTRAGETEGTTVADVYIKTTEGALIKIASGVEYEAPVSQSQGPSIVIDDGN